MGLRAWDSDPREAPLTHKPRDPVPRPRAVNHTQEPALFRRHSFGLAPAGAQAAEAEFSKPVTVSFLYQNQPR